MLDDEDELPINQPHYTHTRYQVTIHDPQEGKQTVKMGEVRGS